MGKLDLTKELKHLYAPSAKSVVEVSVPPMQFLMVDGSGDPNTSVPFQQAMESLFSVSYTLKFTRKRDGIEPDYGVMPPEGLWWMEDMARFSVACKDEWLWTLMIRQPDFITHAEVEQAMAQAGKKKELPALGKMRFETFDEGLAVQILHIGPFSEEGPTIIKMHQFITESGHMQRGKHHEIYLSDIRRADPTKWKTVLRQPMA